MGDVMDDILKKGLELRDKAKAYGKKGSCVRYVGWNVCNYL